MTVPTNTYQTYQQIGIREDLSDMIFNIAPTETPFLSSIKKGKASSTKHEWQTDSLASADGNNKAIEGDDIAADAASPTTRLYNYTQIMTKAPQVSSTGQIVNTAGRKNEMSLQIAKRGKELKRDMEARLTGNYAYVAGNASTERECAGVEAWLTNSSRGSTTGGTAPADPTGDGSDAATDGSVLQAFTEADLKAVIKLCWDAGGEPNLVMVGGTNKQTASGFSGIATQYRENSGQKQATILGAADVYVSDFGTLNIVANRFSRARSALVLDTDYWKLATLQPIKNEKLAKTGLSDKRLMSTEFTLEACAPTASGVVADLTS